MSQPQAYKQYLEQQNQHSAVIARKQSSRIRSAMGMRPHSSMGTKGQTGKERSNSFARIQNTAGLDLKKSSFIQLYTQDSAKVPIYYSRPGPGLYESELNFGRKTQADKYNNGPSYSIPKTRSFQNSSSHSRRYTKPIKTAGSAQRSRVNTPLEKRMSQEHFAAFNRFN